MNGERSSTELSNLIMKTFFKELREQAEKNTLCLTELCSVLGLGRKITDIGAADQWKKACTHRHWQVASAYLEHHLIRQGPLSHMALCSCKCDPNGITLWWCERGGEGAEPAGAAGAHLLLSVCERRQWKRGASVRKERKKVGDKEMDWERVSES